MRAHAAAQDAQGRGGGRYSNVSDPRHRAALEALSAVEGRNN